MHRINPEDFTRAMSAIRCWSAPGVDYDLSHLTNYIINQCGNALDCYLKIFGTADLVRELGQRAIRPSPKYLRLQREYEKLKKQLSDLNQEGVNNE